MTAPSLPSDLPAEFSLPARYKTNRQGPIRWIFFRFMRYWYIGVLILAGAFGNAYLAAVLPIEIGKAFNAVMETPPRSDLLIGFVITIIWTQLLRGVLQFGRNFSAEWLGQLFSSARSSGRLFNSVGTSPVR